MNPRRACIACGLALSLCSAAWAQKAPTPAMPATPPAPPAPAALVPGQSQISFTTKQMGVPVQGRFRKFSALVAFDPKRPETGSIAFDIDTGSARFGSAELDREIVKPAWLDALKFPRAHFQSSRIKALAPGRFEVRGMLTLKGRTRELQVPVTLIQAAVPAGVSSASGSFTINRLDWRVGDGEWADTSLLAGEVQVTFKIALTGLAPL